MNPPSSGSRVPRLTGLSVMTVSLLVQVGWLFDIPFLRQPFANATSMVATTATMILIIGAALWLLSLRRLPLLVILFGFATWGVGLISLGHVVFGPEFSIDKFWLAEQVPLNRMSPLTAMCFLAIGPALAASTQRHRAWMAQILALAAALVATIVMIGYFYEVSQLVGIGLYRTMAPHTALALLVACVGVLFVEPGDGVMRVLTSDTLGAKMARRTLPATIGIPILLGWLRLAGERANLYDPRVGPPLVVVGSMVLISIVIWLNARLIGQIDARRQQAEEDLRRTNESLEVRVAEKTAEALRSQAKARATEERLRAGQRMEAMGELAGGVAHDFNNMMTVVSGYSEMLLGQIPSDSPFRKAVEEIKKAGDRCSRLTSHLLAFSRRQILTPSVMNLNTVIADLGNMLPVLLGEQITVTTTTGTDLWSVRADAAQIEQVIVNLVVNARDAMPRGGTLTIDTRNVVVDERTEPEHPEIPPGPYVRLTVADTGHGMDDETKFLAFDPFFTTKPVGQGTGLGLSTVYGVVKQSDGHICLESSPGTGTTFRIYLPKAGASVGPAAAAPAVERHMLAGEETVLLVEDEETLRRFLRRVLETAGYGVLEAADAAHALDICQSWMEPIDLVLTDVVMPSMSGGELAKNLRLLRPNTPVLFMSGYAQDVVVQHEVSTTAASFLQKPFTPEGLLTRVRQVLDTADGMADVQ